MLATLPLAALLLIWLALLQILPGLDWRRGLLRAAVIWGTFAILSTEALSLLHLVTPTVLSLTWGSLILACLGVLEGRRRRGEPLVLPSWELPSGCPDRALVAGVLLIILITAFVGLVAPPNTADSLAYHMTRVAHWAQEGSLRPFPSGIPRQNLMSPGAEIGVLQLYVLSGGDRLVNLIQWSAMVLSVIGVSVLAKDLGASSPGQLLASVFAASLPMGIAQASSTMTDYVVALWVVAVASEILLVIRGGGWGLPSLFIALGAGLGMVTKPIAYAYLLPLGLFYAVVLLREQGMRTLVKAGALTVPLVLALNLGYFGRNLTLYGSPVGSQAKISEHSNEILDWRVVVSNVLRNASLHAGSSHEVLNESLYDALARLHVKMGIGLTDRRTSVHSVFTIGPPTAAETKAFNNLQPLLMIGVLILLLLRRRDTGPLPLVYAFAVSSTFIVFSVMFKFTVFGSRYHLPFFVLYAPLVGLGLVRFLNANLARILGAILIVASWQWLVGINNRPLIQQNSKQASILAAPREELYLADSVRQPFQAVAQRILTEGCTTVGLIARGTITEYPLWVYLGAPRPDLQIEWIVSETPSARYEKADFEPCAIICEACPEDWERIRGLSRIEKISQFRLFLRSEPQSGS